MEWSAVAWLQSKELPLLAARSLRSELTLVVRIPFVLFHHSATNTLLLFAVIATSAVQGAAKLALEKSDGFVSARMILFAYQRMLDRAAQNDQQQEEYDMYIQQSADLDRALRDASKESGVAKFALTKDFGLGCFFF